jgi:hypothetical protein
MWVESIKKKKTKNTFKLGKVSTPVIQAIQEAEIGKIKVQDQSIS